jgi:hypothetical protein
VECNEDKSKKTDLLSRVLLRTSGEDTTINSSSRNTQASVQGSKTHATGGRRLSIGLVKHGNLQEIYELLLHKLPSRKDRRPHLRLRHPLLRLQVKSQMKAWIRPVSLHGRSNSLTKMSWSYSTTLKKPMTFQPSVGTRLSPTSLILSKSVLIPTDPILSLTTSTTQTYSSSSFTSCLLTKTSIRTPSTASVPLVKQP